MQRFFHLCFLQLCLVTSASCLGQISTDTIVLRDFAWDSTSPAASVELTVLSNGSKLAALMYKASGQQKHPTVILLHGIPGNERNLDLAQVLRARGWNVMFFNYRGSWGSEGIFSFRNCVEDAINVVAFCKRYGDSLHIDTTNIALFGHSMGGWVCLKVLAELPGIKKGFALSAMNTDFIRTPAGKSRLETLKKEADNMFVLNKNAGSNVWDAAITDSVYMNLKNSAAQLSQKQIMMIDEHERNKPVAELFKATNKNYFVYEVWQTNHQFSNKRAALMKKVIEFLNR